MPVQHDATLNTDIEFGECLLSTNKITQDGAKSQAIIIASKHKMGQKVHWAGGL
jgi:hypothetical protein